MVPLNMRIHLYFMCVRGVTERRWQFALIDLVDLRK